MIRLRLPVSFVHPFFLQLDSTKCFEDSKVAKDPDVNQAVFLFPLFLVFLHASRFTSKIPLDCRVTSWDHRNSVSEFLRWLVPSPFYLVIEVFIFHRFVGWVFSIPRLFFSAATCGPNRSRRVLTHPTFHSRVTKSACPPICLLRSC